LPSATTLYPYTTLFRSTQCADVFKSTTAVAPVTSWRYYDSIYTERYLRTPQENPEGYDENSPINFADRMKGNFLLIHGTADDNRSEEHTSELQSRENLV